MTEHLGWLALAMMLAAMLYSSVGHGGASAYLGIMALAAVAPPVMKPVALALNLIVAGIGTVRFVRAGKFDWGLFRGFALPAVPFAFIGGMVQLPPEYYRPLVGAVLWLAAARLLWAPRQLANREPAPPSPWVGAPVGAGLGLLAGLTGTGGGIFLSPLMILLGWANPRVTSGVVAAFIFVNSLAGLLGNYTALKAFPPELPWLAGAVLVGGTIGTTLGVRLLPREMLVRLLGLVLLVAGGKLLFG